MREMFIKNKKGNIVVMFKQVRELREAVILVNHGWQGVYYLWQTHRV